LELEAGAEGEDLEAEGHAGGTVGYVVANLTGGLRHGDWEFNSWHDSAVVDDLDARRGLSGAVLNWLHETVTESHAVHARHHVSACRQLNVDALSDDVVDTSRVWNPCGWNKNKSKNKKQILYLKLPE
jgi:hypothetical protein